MEKMNKEFTMMDLIIETHSWLERQGPGSQEMIIKALSFIDNHKEFAKTLDLACGSGGQTMVLAKNITGKITGVDIIPELINVFNDNAKKLNFKDRVNGIIGSMENLPFQDNDFDLIWSEGAIDTIGFEKGLTYWYGLLKKNGYVVVTCPSWFTNERPAEIEKFWSGAGIGLDTIADNIFIMQKIGYVPIASFILPEKCWIENYFIPREIEDKKLLEKYAGNETVQGYVNDNKYEVELFSKYNHYYGYVFYIGKKI